MRRVAALLGCLALVSAFETAKRTSTRDNKNDVSGRQARDMDDSDGTFAFLLEHSLSPTSPFVERGEVSVHFSQLKHRGTVTFTGTVSPPRQEFESLLASGGRYRLRLTPKHGGDPLVTSVRACALAASAFREELTFHSDVYGSMVSLNYRTPISACSNSPKLARDGLEFHPKGRVFLGRQGERPKNIRVGAFSAGAGPEKKSPGGKEAPVQKSFFQRYWFYLVAFGLFVVTQFLADPEAQEGGGEGGKGK